MVYDDKENPGNSHGKATERSWSLGRRGGGTTNNKGRQGGQFRPLTWPAAKSWSAAKQIQTMSSNLAAPRNADASGLAMPIYIMSTVLVFSMWALVAAIPCQERNGLSNHLPIPKQVGWAQPISGLVEKIGEDWKKREKKGNAGLMEEVQRMEKVAQSLVDFSDSFVFPMEEEKAAEVAALVAELKDVCEKMEEGLRPLQHQVREVFHKVVRSRGEVLDIVEQIGKSTVPVPY